jgi:hypothetical protein
MARRQAATRLACLPSCFVVLQCGTVELLPRHHTAGIPLRATRRHNTACTRNRACRAVGAGPRPREQARREAVGACTDWLAVVGTATHATGQVITNPVEE